MMQPDIEDTVGILADIEALRNRTNRELNADGWQWMLVWSLVAFGASITVLVDALENVAGYYWIAAVPIALAATAFLESRSKQQRAVRRDMRPYWTIGAGIGILNLLASLTLESEMIVIVIWIVIGVGFAGFAILDRDRPTAVMFFTAALITALLGFLSADPFIAYATISMLYAGLLAGSAVQVYGRYRSA
jgi:hypothetical protein